MNIKDTIRLLAVAATFDQRLKPPTEADAQARAVAWHAALDNDMAPDHAEQTVIRHYAERTTAIMPADVNHAWREYRRAIKQAEAAEQYRLQIEAAEAEACPPPPEVLLAMRSFRKRAV